MEAQTKSPALIYAETHSFSHDISHCNPDPVHLVCTECKRYAAHLNLNVVPSTLDTRLVSYLSEPQHDCVSNNFSLYSPLK